MAVITVTWVTLGYQLPCCPHYERLAPGLAASVVLLLPSEMFPVSGPWAVEVRQPWCLVANTQLELTPSTV